MFKPGNKYGVGRPKISLNKPELLLPIIFQKAHINWAHDFCLLYKNYKAGVLDQVGKEKIKFYLEIMPYLCTKVNLKDLDASKFVTERDQKAMTDQTRSLIEALENVNNVPKSKPSGTDQKAGLADGEPPIPPTL